MIPGGEIGTVQVTFLDSSLHLIEHQCCHCVSREDIATIIGSALFAGAAGIMLTQHFDSQEPRPTPDETAWTGRLFVACEPFDLILIDRIIFGPKTHFSFRERGYLDH
ncbi:JAB domain-containing protein [Sphingomonas astaxanthinifaciens]|uniref:JAB domain-containing protein n=1 Tax=Sphingomonas astaxanthinifaciens TaxID=407019 RepID=UPI003CCC1F13